MSEIQTKVGDEMRLVDLGIFLEVHQQIADHYRALGLNGNALDVAIGEMLPLRLAQILDRPELH